MDYVRLGASGLKVSRACLGTMNFGPAGGVGVGSCEEPEARRIVDAFLDAGHHVIDTADAYTRGESERIVGRAVKGRRDSVVLATKAFLPQGPGANDRGLSRAHLTRALDASLRRLGTDYVDLYQCHQWDPDTPIEETMATLDGFVRSGKVRYLGCSNFTAAQIVESQWAAERVGGTRFVSLQPQYSLLARDIEAEVLPTCERHGLGTLTWSPLGGGVLTGRYARGGSPDRDSRIGRLLASPRRSLAPGPRSCSPSGTWPSPPRWRRSPRPWGRPRPPWPSPGSAGDRASPPSSSGLVRPTSSPTTWRASPWTSPPMRSTDSTGRPPPLDEPGRR